MKIIVKQTLIGIKHRINANPKLKIKIMSILNRFPMLKARLKRIHYHQVSHTSLISNRTSRELLVDITHVYSDDLKTGIQRVVRSILNELENNDAIENIDVQPIFLTDRNGYWHYRYVKDTDTIVIPKVKDIFLGLDLNAGVTEAAFAGLFDDWKLRGVQINFVVYDILPILHPYWWQDGIGLAHEAWLKTLLHYSDQIICISKSVSNDVREYLIQHTADIHNQPAVNWFHLGADIDSSLPSKGISEDAQYVLNRLKSEPSFLSVGTIEPRKGYKQTLNAFEKLWLDGMNINFVIVGKQGWMVDELAAKIRNHPELNKRLFWLEGISDEYLEKVYAASICLIAASEGEGFGLPLIEAAQKELSIIARDILVFREVAGEYAYYFKNNHDTEALADTIAGWLALYKGNNQTKSDKMPWMTWEQSTHKLVDIITKNKIRSEKK